MGTVLVVEDNADIRLLLVELFECEGFDVRSCADGRQALASLEELGPHACVVLDLMLPVVTGWDVLKAVRARRNRPGVVVLSADPKAAAAEADVVLSKPFDAAQLVAHVRRLVAPVAA